MTAPSPDPLRWLLRNLAEFLGGMFLILLIGAYVYDELWLGWRGKEPWAVCVAFSLLPLKALEAVGMLLLLGAILSAILREKRWAIVLGFFALLTMMPSIWLPPSLLARCPALLGDQTDDLPE